jgi:hypothetical protein
MPTKGKTGKSVAKRRSGAPSGRRRAQAGDSRGRRAKSQQPVDARATQRARMERERGEMTRERAERKSQRELERAQAEEHSEQSVKGRGWAERNDRDDEERFDRS